MRNVAIVAGGYSSEYVISVQSGAMLQKEIEKAGYHVFLIEISPEKWVVHLSHDVVLDIDKSDFSFVHEGRKVTFDAVVMAIHGTPGEDGKLQAYFDLLNIPYTCCGVLASAITFNKSVCKTFVTTLGIKTASSIRVARGMQFNHSDVISQLGLPCIVKPNESGSSFGVSKVNNIEELTNALEIAFKESSEVLIEKYIQGTEVTCGMINLDGNDLVFPITEIVSKKEFFDYEAKYTSGMSDEITPARIDNQLVVQIQNCTRTIYHALGCRGITRTDYIISDGQIYFLEVNTVPGMSPNSIIPKQLKTMNIGVSEIYSRIIENICSKR